MHNNRESQLNLIRIIIVIMAGILFSADVQAFGFWNQGDVVVANRASGSISVIDAKTDTLSNTYDLPAGANTPEPMYVFSYPYKKRCFVGDRANNRIVVFNSTDYSVETTVPAGAGVFHMWGATWGKQLWVNNDIDNTCTVIDMKSLGVIATVLLPADLVALGGKPHDVILDYYGKYAYVSMVGFAGAEDYVVKFSTQSFTEVARTTVGKDPHLSLNRWNHLLYVPCQGNNAVFVLQRHDLSKVLELDVPGAHGAGMSKNGLFFYTTNISGGGTDALYTIFTLFNMVFGGAVDTPYPVPHNIALTPNGRKLYITHSGGASDKISVFKIKGFFFPKPVYSREITVGLNPFGLAYVR